MRRRTYKISYYILYAIFAVIFVVVALFFGGGSADGDAAMPGVDPSLWQPAYTDALLFLMYALLAVALLVSLVAIISRFVSALKENTRNALRVLGGFVLLLVVLAVTWVTGDETPLNIPGYDGADNVPFWLKTADMFLYSIYTLLAVAVIAIIFSAIKKRFL